VTAMLELRGASRHFGGLKALDRVSLTLDEGEIVGLIGPNGAGKTTLVNVVTGVTPATHGQVLFHGQSIERLSPDRIAHLGIARTSQIEQPFPRMTTLENVMSGALFSGGSRTLAEARAAAHEHLAFTGLADVADKPASALTLAGRKRLELARSLAMRPKLLMLDEVNAGLNTAEIDAALDLIKAIAARGITILLIEHLMKVVLNACGRIAVLHHGSLIADGAPRDIMRDAGVIEAYLGSKFAARYAGAPQ
jgi:branched-chain amino acid transport system ATP-binding protein